MLRLACLASLLTSPAMAGVLPITGTYCGEDDFVNANGEYTDVSECRFVSVIETGSTWYVVTVKCRDGASGRLRVDSVATSKAFRSVTRTTPANLCVSTDARGKSAS